MWIFVYFIACCWLLAWVINYIYSPLEVNNAKAFWMGKRNIWDVRLPCRTKDDVDQYCNAPNEFIPSYSNIVLCDGPKSKECVQRLASLGYNNVYFCKDFLHQL